MICWAFGYCDLKLSCWLLNHVRAVIRSINRELFNQKGGDDKLC